MMFRKAALERLSSPEQMDQLMQVTRPTGWLALGSFALVVVATLAWSIFGNLPHKANGQGILIRSGGVFDVVTAGAGPITRLRVKEGDRVGVGQWVADIAQPDLELRIRNARGELEDAQKRYHELARYQEKDATLGSREYQQQRESLIKSIAWYEEQVGFLQDKLDSQQELLSDGVLAPQAVQTTEVNLRDTQRRLAEARTELEKLEISRLQAGNARDQDTARAMHAVLQAQQDLEQLEAELALRSHVVCHYAGQVVEVLAYEGIVIGVGEAVVSVELAENELIAAVYVPAMQVKAVQKGMSVQLSPSGVQEERYGYLMGEVAYVAEFPASERAMMRLLENEALVRSIAQQGLPTLVSVKLIPDEHTPSGYKWSTSRGPNLRMTSGSVCTANVVVESQRPISLVIPILRGTLGL